MPASLNQPLRLVTLCVALLIAACGGGGGDEDGVDDTSGTLVGAGGGTVTGPAGASVVVPTGALAQEARIEVAQTSAGAPPLPAGLTAFGPMFAFTPHGTQFSEPVTVTLPFDLAAVPAGSSPRLLKTNARNEWEHVATATFKTGSVSARIDGFSSVQVVIPPLQPFPPTRMWSFGVLEGKGLVEREVDGDTQVGGPLKKTIDFGPASVTRDALLVDGLLSRGDGRAIGDIGGSADGVTYWVGTAARTDGTIARLTQTQTFLKNSSDATYSFTISDVQLDVVDGNAVLGRDCRGGFFVVVGVCDIVGAHVFLNVQAFFEDPVAGSTEFAQADGFAELRGGAVFDVITGTGRASWDETVSGTIGNALWSKSKFTFTKEPFNGPDGKYTMRLKRPLTFFIDLSSVPNTGVFTVKFQTHAMAYNRGATAVLGRSPEFAIGSTAYLRDPASIGGTTVTTTGLTAIATRAVPDLPARGLQPPAPCLAAANPDPAAGTLQFRAAAYALHEGSTRPTIEVTREGGSRGSVTVDIASSDGSALAGIDYRPIARTIVFADGDATPRLLDVQTIQNTVGGQASRTVALTLTQPGGCASLGAQSTAVLSILDDDPAPTTPPVGGLDASFGSAGKATLAGFGGDDSAMALQADGKIVMVGGSTNEFVLARFNADGSLDTGFGSAGRVSTDVVVGGVVEEIARAVAVQADGKIVVAGHVRTPGGPLSFVLARYLANGSLDAGFGSAGLVVGPVVGRALAVALQPDGRIVVAGDDAAGDFRVARYLADGTLDASFGTGGQVTTDIAGGTDTARNLVLQPNGAIVVSGDPFGNDLGTDVARYTAAGVLDASFGNGGKVTLPGTRVGEGLALQGDGKLVLVGNVLVGNATRFATTRLLANGTVDTGFGTAGTVVTDISGRGDAAHAVTVQADGRIVVAGRSSSQTNANFAVARYLSNGAIDPAFGTAGTLTVDFFGFTDAAESVVLQADGRVVLGGVARNNVDGYGLVRLLP